MQGPIVITVLFGVLMTPQAAPTGFLGSGVFKGEDFAFVSAAVDVLFARTMAGFTPLPFRPFARLQLPFHGGGEMRGGLEMVINVFVAGLACIGADVQIWIGGEKRLLWRRLSLIAGLFVS